MPRDTLFDTEKNGHEATTQCRRAAVWLWFIGGVAATISLFLLVQAPALRQLTHEEISRMMGGVVTDPPLTGADVAQLLTLVVGLFGLLPGSGYIVGAFFVRRGLRPAMWVMLVGLYLQLAIVGFYIVGGIIGAFQQGNRGLLTMIVLVLGTTAAALLHTARTIHRAQSTASSIEAVDSDPWR